MLAVNKNSQLLMLCVLHVRTAAVVQMSVSVCQLMKQCTAEELTEVVLPHLSSSLSLWQYLSASSRAVMSPSSSATDSPASVPTDIANSHIDIASMLDEFAVLRRSVHDFCNELLEEDTRPAGECDKIARALPDKDSVADSTMLSMENCLRGSNLGADTELDPVPNTDNMRNVEDPSTNRNATSFLETLQNVDPTPVGNCSEDANSLVESGMPQNLVDRVSACSSRSKEPNVDEQLMDRNTTSTESFALDESKVTETGNVSESNVRHHTASEITVVSPETDSFSIMCAAGKFDCVDLPESDCCEKTVDITDSELSDAVKTGIADTAAATLCRENNLSSLRVDNVRPENDCHTACSGSANETASTSVIVVANALEVSLIYVALFLQNLLFFLTDTSIREVV